MRRAAAELAHTRRVLASMIAAMLGAAAAAAPAEPGALLVTMHAVDASGVGAPLGQVRVVQTRYGVVFTPDLTGLPGGLHGFHVHQNPNCGSREQEGKAVPGGAAGGHYDPEHSGRHAEPWGEGHRGDLPPVHVDASGHATQPVLAPRLSLAELDGRSLMIHAGGDNHADHPMPLGGGGARLVCGVIRF